MSLLGRFDGASNKVLDAVPLADLLFACIFLPLHYYIRTSPTKNLNDHSLLRPYLNC